MNALAPVINTTPAPTWLALAGGGSPTFWFVGISAVAVAGWLTRDLPGWVMMWAIAATEFFVLKLATLRGCDGWYRRGLGAGYLFAWAGMNAPAFLRGPANSRVPAPPLAELGWALLKLGFGSVLSLWAIRHVTDFPPMLVGWTGMFGIIFA